MALKNISMCLESNSMITHDVKFVFDNQQTPDEPASVSAHRVILSIASDVFKTEFYGAIREPDDDIKIVDASYDAFKAMVEFIYDMNHDWKSYSLNFLADMYYLAEKYHLDVLKVEVLAAVGQYQVRRTNFLEVATLAEKQSHHTALSKCLYKMAAQFLKRELNSDFKEVLKLFSEVEADPNDTTNSFILHKLMTTLNDLSPPLSPSYNCKNIPCLEDRLRTNRAAGTGWDKHW